MVFEYDAFAELAFIRLEAEPTVRLSQLSQASQGGRLSMPLGGEAQDTFEERAAIMEYEGGLTRAEAEASALTAVFELE